MQDWSYTFDPVSKADWIRQIEADLKGVPLSSLMTEWWKSERLDPLLQHEEVSEEPVRLPDDLFHRPPAITERIDTTSLPATDVNKRILDALASGAEIIVLRTAGHTWDAGWMKDVHTDMVSIQVQPNDLPPGDVSGFLRELPSFASLRVPRYSAKEHNVFRSALPVPGISDDGDRILFTYDIPHEEDWMHAAALVCNHLIDDVKTWADAGLEVGAFFKRVLLQMETSGDYFLQLLQARVIQLLWQNLVPWLTEVSAKADSIRLEIQITQHADEDPDLFLIRASMSGLAASLSGASAVCIHPTDSGSLPGLYPRVSRNIHHLLHLESQMYKGKDPMAGSYMADHYTRKWSGEIWRRLHAEK